MARKIQIDVSGFDETLQADLLDNNELADRLWNELNEPIKMWTVQTASTGDWFSGRGRPSSRPQQVGTQASPIGHSVLMTQIEPGSIVYAGYRYVGFAYGPDVTEPLTTTGPVVARVDDLSTLYRAGQHVCDSHFKTHKLVTLTIRRMGEQ